METIKIVISVVLGIALSVLMIVNPELLWRIEHYLSVSKESEPSDLYISLMRVSGTLLLVGIFVVGIIVVFKAIVG